MDRWIDGNESTRLDQVLGVSSMLIARRKEPARWMQENGESSAELVSDKLAPGPITWHHYTSDARMEHRLNHFPKIAARVYELGLGSILPFYDPALYLAKCTTAPRPGQQDKLASAAHAACGSFGR
jgi:hypothetical protein